MVTPKQPTRFKSQFLEAVSQILDPSSPKGNALLNYLQRTGKQLNLQDVDVREILNEAAYRGLRHIDRNQEEIEAVEAWLRKVCAFILYDMVKDEKRMRELKIKNTGTLGIPDLFSKMESDEKKKALDRAFVHLSKEDQKILKLRFYQEKKYKEIQEYYLKKTGELEKESALRKRESRALKRLRVRFQEEYR